MLYVLIRCSDAKQKRRMLIGIVFSGFIQSLYGWAQHFGWADSNHTHFELTGSFPNPGPLGGFIGVSLIICIGFIGMYLQRKRYAGIVLLLFPGLSLAGILLLSFSRAAWLALLIAAGYGFARKLFSRATASLSLIVFSLLCASFLYFLKRDSADARLFIWKVSGRMFTEAPVTGKGAESFAAGYMYAQADHFHEHPHSTYRKRSSDNTSAFNEYIRIGCEYGVTGLLLLFAVFLVKPVRKGYMEYYLLAPVSIYFLIFSFFSYPTEVFPLIAVLTVTVAARESRTVISLPAGVTRGISSSALILLLVLLPFFYHKKQQLNVMDICLHEHMRDPNPDRAEELFRLYPSFKLNRIYVSGCARLFYENNEYDKAFVLLQQAAALFPSSQILCDLGNCAFYLNKYEEAEKYLTLASEMVPSRIIPVYSLFRFYAETGSSVKAVGLGYEILATDFKREGSVAKQAKQLIRGYLHETGKEVPPG